MKCPECHTDNADTRKFCRQCGTKLLSLCRKCGYENLPDDKFCGECGNTLEKISKTPPVDYSAPQSYTPKHLADKILTSRNAIEGERKTVTILFADVAGSTAMFEKLDPEAVHEIMNGCFRILMDQVHRYEGTINQFRGDGVMALFGAPIAHEDHANRACQASLAIQKALTPYRNELNSRYGIDFTMRVGLNTGPVVVGAIGDDLRMDYTAQGDTANLAARMETLAEPGSVFVSENTFALTEGFFRFENLGRHSVKGKALPVGVYRPIAPSSRRTRFDVNAERGLTPLVGRYRDLEMVLKAFHRAKEGSGQAVVIKSEAGVGKSRLLYEFRKAIGNEDVFFFEGKCLSYSRNVAYHPIIDILKSFFHIDDGQAESEIGDKIARGLDALKIEPGEILPYLLELLSVENSGIDQATTGPEAMRERINEALIRLVIKGARLHPLIIAIEDLHWIDAGSMGVIGDLLDSITAEPIFFVFTCRPQFAPEWRAKSYLHQITLSRLSEDDSLSMASHLLQTDQVENEVARLVYEKTDGVPFFIEEFVKSLKDLDIIHEQEKGIRLVEEKTLNIPSTIQDIIMARVDLLPEAAKQIVKTGSAIEREFSHQLIRRATGLEAGELAAGLSTLKDAELIYQRGIDPDTTYIFKHALTMEVVYLSLLTSQKQQLHRIVGRAIETLHPDAAKEHSATLARHFTEAGLFEEAATYAKAAAKKAMHTGAYTDAISHAHNRVHALEQLPTTRANQKRLIDARTVLASYYMALNLHSEAKDAVDPIVDAAIELDYRKRLPGIYVAMGSYYLAYQDSEKALSYLRKAVDEAERIGDFYSLWQGNYFLGAGLCDECRFENAIACYSVSLALSEASHNLRGISYAKGTMSTFALSFYGKIEAAYGLSVEAVRAARQCGDAHTKGMAYSAHGQVCFFKGDFQQARSFLSEAIDLCTKSGHLMWRAWGEFWLAHNCLSTQNYEEAITLLNGWFSTMKAMNIYYWWKHYGKVLLAWAALADGRPLITGFEPADYQSESKSKLHTGAIESTIARIMMNLDPRFIPEAETAIQTAIAADRRNQTRWYLGQDYAIYAELNRQKGDEPGARANLNNAIEVFRECGADGWVDKLEKQLD